MAAYRDQSESEAGVVPADRFAVNAMFCPGCRAVIREAVETCPACGYSGGWAVEKFPFAAPEWETFMDPDHRLGSGVRREIEEALGTLAQRFPQPCLCFCLVGLERETDPREFGFWLMNASPVSGLEEDRRRWGVLFVIDHAQLRVSVTPGYAIEPFLNEESWKSLLELEARAIREGDFGEAILRWINGAFAVFSEAAIRATEGSGKKGKGRSW